MGLGQERFTVLLLAFVLGCSKRSPVAHDAGAPVPSTVVTEADAAPDPGPIRVEEVKVPGDLSAYAVRGARVHRTPMVFVPGMCVHPEGYVMSFAHAAAAHGDLVGVQGDVACAPNSPFRRWSYDLEAMDRRIETALRASGLDPARGGIMVIGYSQGAERAEKLVARFPSKYASAILIASPIAPSPALLGRARAVALMAGTLDGAHGAMQAAVPSLRRAKIEAAFFSLPGARHGQLGEHPNESMREAIDFVARSNEAVP